ncbi:MAG: hypothetical protein EHM77_07650 [Planctomycetaceae bacterium]|nr:MAG: hypothetical protein EHM77_07650 [Planctomycetaceae bacterium]
MIARDGASGAGPAARPASPAAKILRGRNGLRMAIFFPWAEKPVRMASISTARLLWAIRRNRALVGERFSSGETRR